VLLQCFLRYPGHPQTPSISPVQSTTTVTLPLSPTLHLPLVTAPRHEWIWAPVSLQKITTISTATFSIVFACRTGPMCMKACQLRSMRPTALQTVCFHITTTVISEGTPQTQRCVTYRMHFLTHFARKFSVIIDAFECICCILVSIKEKKTDRMHD